MPLWCLNLVQCVAKLSVFFPSRAVCRPRNVVETSSSRPQSFLNFRTNEDCNDRSSDQPGSTSSGKCYVKLDGYHLLARGGNQSH